MTGIYKITNKLNGHSYIGQSIDIKARWRQHRNSITNMFKNSALISAFRKYGLENFTFEIIELCKVEELNEKEIYYIKKYNTYYDGYNSTLGGDGSQGCELILSHQNILEIYDLLKNSNITQREIAKKYGVGEDIISHINQGHNRRLPGYVYPIRQNHSNKIIIKQDDKLIEISEKNVCPKCGKFKSPEAQMCWECYKIYERKVERPDKITLAKEIINSSFCAVGRKYGVSDSAIRKWCKTYNMPTKKEELKQWLEKISR